MPEARLSTAGKFEDIQESTYDFIKKAGVPVYSIKMKGDYFAKPKWGKGLRRGAVVEATLDKLFSANELTDLSTHEIKLRVEVSGDGTQATFYYSIEDGEWQQIGEPQTTKILTDEHARGFTGACFGMYVRDMDSLCLTADFDYFKVED